MLDILVRIVELYHKFTKLTNRYERPSLRSFATPKTSFLVMGFKSIVSSSGMA